MNDKKIIFMGTPHIAAQHLQYLIDSSLNIIGVFTQPPRKKNRGMHIKESPVHQIAKKNNLQTFYPSSIDYSVIEKIKSLNPDIIIVVAYGIILPSQFLHVSAIIETQFNADFIREITTTNKDKKLS